MLAAGAAVACFLKGHPLRGLAALVVVGGGVAMVFALSSPAASLVGMLAIAIVTLWLAWPGAEPGSYWDRHGAIDRDGVRFLDKEPAWRRRGRMLAGALIGLVPGAAIIFGVFVVDAIFDLTGDQAQIAFLGIPVGFFGMLGGAWIGHQWVPRDVVPSDRHPVAV